MSKAVIATLALLGLQACSADDVDVVILDGSVEDRAEGERSGSGSPGSSTGSTGTGGEGSGLPGVPASECDADRPCPSADFACVAQRCVFQPPVRVPTAVQHSTAGGVARNGQYVLEVTTGGPAIYGTMSSATYVLQLRGPTQH